MKIIKGIKQMYYLTSLQKGLQALGSIEDANELVKQIDSNMENLSHVKDMFRLDNSVKKNMQTSPELSFQLLYYLHYTPYVQHFVNKDFEEAFYLGYGLFNTTNTHLEKKASLNWALDALGQVKTEYMKNGEWLDYNRRFNTIETDLLSEAKMYASREKDDKNVGYNGIYMACAYLKFVSHDIAEAHEYINQQIELFTKEEVVEREILGKKEMWFYQSMEPTHKAHFENFLKQVLDVKADNSVENHSTPRLG